VEIMSDVYSERSSNSKSQAIDSQGQDLHPQSIVNIVAILSDGKETMRGPSGTGFFVESKGHESACQIATSLHAIIPDSRAPLASLEVTLDGGQKYTGKFVKVDRPHDLAILSIEGADKAKLACPALDLSETPATAGENVNRLTRSRWGDESSNVGKFNHAANRQDIELVPLEGEDPNRKMLVFDLYNNRGVDLGGSPILDDSGKVIAIHNGGLDGKTSVATPVDDLKGLLH
jgi:hypothetical protein